MNCTRFLRFAQQPSTKEQIISHSKPSTSPSPRSSKKYGPDSEQYISKKLSLQSTLTVWGKQSCRDVLLNPSAKPTTLHVAQSLASAKHEGTLELMKIASERKPLPITIAQQPFEKIGRMSRHESRCEGVCLDVDVKDLIIDMDSSSFISSSLSSKVAAILNRAAGLIALDEVQNPQNVGLVLRACAATGIPVLIPRKGCSELSDPLLLRASVGSLFRLPLLLRTESVASGLSILKSVPNTQPIHVHGLDASSPKSENLFSSTNSIKKGQMNVFVLGSESNGLSQEVKQMCNTFLRIPMDAGVESLNVSQAATLVAYRAKHGLHF